VNHTARPPSLRTPVSWPVPANVWYGGTMRRVRVLAFALATFSVVAACAAAAPTAATPPPPAPSASAAPVASSIVEAGAPEDAAPAAVMSVDAESPTPPAPTSACNEQSPQDFLVRSNFLKTPGGNQRAIQYRTDTYGFFSPFGKPGADRRPPSAFVVDTTFMGLPVRMHRKVVPALKCAEEEIRLSCADHPYTAHALAGIRFKNTYRGGEVTNHIFGIAIDIDPSINTCCGCVKPWNDAPRCRRPAKTEYDRMEMPECWVHAFERYGFYWLGHDVLQDTMHFEFLGDPDKILRSPPAPASDAGAAP
jgi:D-alanyl-D-alanine carboxypeptidase